MGKTFRAVAQYLSVSAALFCFALPTSARSSLTPSGNSSTSYNMESVAAKLPLAFEENLGQVDPAVKFIVTGSGYRVFFTPREAVMAFVRSQSAEPGLKDLSGTVVRMRFDGANVATDIDGEERLPHKTNYFIGSDSGQTASSVANYQRVKYKDLYPGIDLIYYGRQGALEFDFIVAPRAEPTKIKLDFSGADKISLSEHGALIISSPVGEVIYEKPVAYQQIRGKKRQVPVEYRLAANGAVAFQLGKYDTRKPLVIDPIVNYSSIFWGKANSVAVDDAGNAYITGYVWTSDLPAATGYQTRLAGSNDAFVAKLDPSGTKLVYATYLGVRQAQTYGNSIAVDSAGNAYLAGTTNSASFPVTSGAYQTTFASGASFVTKLNATGNSLIYSTFVNGTNIKAIAVDATGSAYITGSAQALITTSGAFQSTRPGDSSSPFVAKLNSSGTEMAYATYLGGTNNPEYGNAIAVDTDGYAYVTGSTWTSTFPTQNAYQSSLRGEDDAFVTKINQDGSSLVYSTYLGGSGVDGANGIAVNASGEAFVVGYTMSNDFHVTPQAFQPTKSFSGTSGFITKLSSTGQSLVYSSYLGGLRCSQCTNSPNDEATSVAIDAAGYAYVGGFTGMSAFPSTDSFQSGDQSAVSSGDSRYNTLPFIAKIRPRGDKLIYSALVGKRDQDHQINSIAVDRNGRAYVVGILYAPAIHPYTVGALLTSSAGDSFGPANAFVMKISTGKYPTTVESSPNPAVAGQTITLTATVQSTALGGTVTFMSGTTEVGVVPVSDGVASLTTTLPLGVHRITATYSGDGIQSPPVFQIISAQ